MRKGSVGGALATLAVVVQLAVAPCARATPPLPLRPPDARGALGNERLSDERTLTRWAYAVRRGWIHRRPAPDSGRVARLHWSTEEGQPEVYPALRSRRDADGARWILIRVPGRPNGRTGWVRERTLSALHAVTTELVVDRESLTATLYRDGRRVFGSPIGVGKASTPTPAGHFWIRERLRNLAGGDPVYGPLAFGTAAYSEELTEWPGGGVVGIHGTDAPRLIPGRPSHGCIRLPNPKILELARLMPIGTPVLIR